MTTRSALTGRGETFPFAFTECMFVFPKELSAAERVIYAEVVDLFNARCFENEHWMNDPVDVCVPFRRVGTDVDIHKVWRLIDRLFSSVSATLYRQAMPDGTWWLGVVRSLALVRAA